MYIKQVIIFGFRSFRDQTIIEPFSPRHNVIVGRNGSGKSNFFFAIQFVLSDEFSNLSQQQRQQLLHEGPGPRVMSAYVEIIFDNSDSRMPIVKEEVSIRRVFGAKKDSYYMDKKHVTKTDVMNLLESAGLSRSNPYYIVKQGKINQLALSPDSQRLTLLREVAGTRVFDERKEESKKILEGTELKRDRIEEMLTTMNERLEALEEEKEELSKYQELDKTRRSLEYTIHDRDLRAAREELEKLETKRLDSKDVSYKQQKEMEKAQADIKSLEQTISEMKVEVDGLVTEKKQLSDENQDMMKLRAQLEFQVKDLEGMLEDEAATKEGSASELIELETMIEEKQAQLDEMKPAFKKQKDEEEELNSRMRSLKERKMELFSKQGRAQKFTTAKERDKALKQSISAVKASLEEKQRLINRGSAEVERLSEQIQTHKEEIKEREDDLQNNRRNLVVVRRDSNDQKLKLDDLQSRRNELWRKQNTNDMAIHNTQAELAKCELALRSRTPRSSSNATEAVRAIVEEKQIRGYHGTFMEVFNCDPSLFTAVDVVAGGRLFHHVVDSDRTATQILTIANKEKRRGEFNFFPLNRLNAREPRYPSSQFALPMIEKLSFDPMYRPAMLTVFGQLLVCKDSQKASEISKSSQLDCITLEGDFISRKGTLSGGYYDPNKCTMKLHASMIEQKQKLEAARADREYLQQEIDDLDAQVTQALRSIQLLENKERIMKDNIEMQENDIKALHDQVASNSRAIESQKRALDSLNTDVRSMSKSLSNMKSELGSELHSQLEPDEQQELEDLLPEMRSLEKKLFACVKHRSTLQSEMDAIQSLLTDNWLKQKEELKARMDSVVMSDNEQQLDLKKKKYHHLSSNIEAKRERIASIEEVLERHNVEVKKLESQVDQLKVIEEEHKEKVAEDSKAMEKLANKRSMLGKKKDLTMRKIRDLGSLPSEAFNKYTSLRTSQLWGKLEKCNEELKKYGHVNQKALDQFATFSERRAQLMTRKEQLDKDYKAILELIEVLDMRKHEAILFTHKQVAKNFEEVFKELVPDGSGKLIMKSSAESVSGTESQSSQSEPETGTSSGVETFTGVSIRVSFSSSSSDTKELQQLSGGQKSLVALALIFAIQKCDPAPFYLFDEIDQALDSHHRMAVAGLIHRLADNAQFITTTFRPELLERADKFYGVTFTSKVSVIRCVSQDEASDFIEKETADK